MKRAVPRREPQRTYSKHGLTSLKQAVYRLGSRVIDRRTALGRALAQWRSNLVDDLGGKDAITTQQAAVIDLAVKTKLLVDSIDTWLLVQPSLINKRKRAVLPVVRERQQLADALARYMTTLGLERRAKPTSTLAGYIETKYGAQDGAAAEPIAGSSARTPIPRDPPPASEASTT